MKDDLKVKFKDLWLRMGAYGNYEKVFDRFVECYSEPHRHYHVLDHPAHCWIELEQYKGVIDNLEAIQFVIMGHDSIYDTRRDDNEEMSTLLSAQIVQKARMPFAFQKDVQRLTMVTNHKTIPRELDEKILVDVDLSIFGQPPKVFNQYEKQIRKEYAWVPEKDYIAGRTDVLINFLKRPSIFSTKFFYDKYEEQARLNLRRSLHALARKRE